MMFTEENNKVFHVLVYFRSCFYYSHDNLYKTRPTLLQNSAAPSEQVELWVLHLPCAEGKNLLGQLWGHWPPRYRQNWSV